MLGRPLSSTDKGIHLVQEAPMPATIMRAWSVTDAIRERVELDLAEGTAPEVPSA
jgi:hypothetical protein